MPAAAAIGLTSVKPENGHHAAASDSDSASGLSDDSETYQAYRGYEEGRSIDWTREADVERARKAELRKIPGLQGVLSRVADDAIPWIVTVSTGACVGLLAAYLDILTAWLGDLRRGVCPTNLFLSQTACCSGLDAGEQCREWLTWSQVIGGSSLSGTLMQYSIYVSLAIAFATTAAFLVDRWGPLAFHSGVPEVKAILGGLVLRAYLGPWTLLIKALGLCLAVASGLSLGKEGPMVHVACCVGNLIARQFPVFRDNEARRRDVLSAASAAGLSVAFGAPMGGVAAFALEEASSFVHASVLWHSFVAAIVAVGVLSYMDTDGSGTLVMFEAHGASAQVWRSFELLPWLFLGVCGGLFGHFFIQMNIAIARFRESSKLRDHPIAEVAFVAFGTALLSYLLPLLRIPTNELVSSLFSACTAVEVDNLGLRNYAFVNILSLTVSAVLRTGLTAVTFGLKVPAGIFLPSIAIGASFGRAVGLVFDAWQRAWPSFWLFSGCPPDGTCISPSLYAVIGAASAVGGMTRMTLSLIVVFYELTAAAPLSMGLMISVLVSKFLADYLSRNGIYEAWIYFRNLVFLNPKIEFRKDDAVARDYLPPSQDLAVLEDAGWTIDSLAEFVREEPFRGFPIVRDLESMILLGYISAVDLSRALREVEGRAGADGSAACRFFDPPAQRRRRSTDGGGTTEAIVLRKWVEDTPLTLSQETPIEDVVKVFQRLGLRHVLFTSQGRLAGMLTKTDVYRILRAEGSLSTRADIAMERSSRARMSQASHGPSDSPRRSNRRSVASSTGLLDDMSVASTAR